MIQKTNLSGNQIIVNLANFLVPLAILFAGGLLITFGIYPYYQKIQSDRDAINQIESAISNLEKKEQELVGWQGKEIEINENLGTVEKALPSKPSLASLAVGVNNLAASERLSIKSFTIQSPASQSAEAQVKFDLSLEGPLTQIVSLISKMTYSVRLLDLKTVRISGREAVYSISLNITAPYKSIIGISGNVEDPLPQFSKSQEDSLAEVSKLPNYYTQILAGASGKDNPFK